MRKNPFVLVTMEPSYTDAKKYWDQVDANIEGMLGGYGSLTAIDAATNKRFIKEFVDKGLLKTNYCCGIMASY
jgi:protein N-terminal methyltransferase